MRVQITYADESVWTGEWELAPKYEIQIICYKDPTGTFVFRHGGDYYELVGGEVVPHDRISLIINATRKGFDPSQHRHPEIALLEFAADEMGWAIGSMVGPVKWKRIFGLATENRRGFRDEDGDEWA